nr:glycosyl transferase family 1 [Paracoccaceae bacterium]
LYLAHDLNDAAIWRRVEMLHRAGATVTVAGFRRHDGALGGPAREIGRTRDGRMIGRIAAVLRLLPRPARVLDGAGSLRAADIDVILARNIEMLVLGARLKRAAAPQARLVYELLDVHRLLSGKGWAGRVLRAIERHMLVDAAGMIHSSDGFRSLHPGPFSQMGARVRLVENKPLAMPGDETRSDGLVRTAATPVVIGWFGILRCAWSLDTLDRVTRAAPGRWKVVLRGRPALDQIPDFHDRVAANPDLEFHGPYRAPQDLADIYGTVDLAWLIDRFEAGGNSDWLLPNRLYEGGLHGAPPIVLAGTELARRAGALGIGLEVAEPSVAAVTAALAGCDAPHLRDLRAAVLRHPRTTWQADAAECQALLAWLAGLGPSRPAPAGVTVARVAP